MEPPELIRNNYDNNSLIILKMIFIISRLNHEKNIIIMMNPLKWNKNKSELNDNFVFGT